MVFASSRSIAPSVTNCPTRRATPLRMPCEAVAAACFGVAPAVPMAFAVASWRAVWAATTFRTCVWSSGDIAAYAAARAVLRADGVRLAAALSVSGAAIAALVVRPSSAAAALSAGEAP